MESILQNVFSVGVAAFLLARMERELRALRSAIETLRHCPICRVSPWRIDLDIDADEDAGQNEIPY